MAHATECDWLLSLGTCLISNKLAAGALEGSLVPWLAVAEECHAEDLLFTLVSQFASELASSEGGRGGGAVCGRGAGAA